MDSANSSGSTYLEANNFSAPNETRSIQSAPNSSVEILLRKLFNSFHSESLSADSSPHKTLESNQQFEGNLLLLLALLVFINLIVIFGNILVILAVYATAKLRNVTNIFTVSLATADLLLGIFVLPYAVMFEILDVWVFGKVWCRGWLVADVWISTASILNLCAISVDRYVAVTRPVRYRSIMTARRAKTIVAGVWIVSFLICCPPLWPQWEPSATSITRPETKVAPLTNPIEVNKSRRLQPTLGHQFQSVSAGRDQLETSALHSNNARMRAQTKGTQAQKLNTMKSESETQSESKSQSETVIEIEPISVLQSDLEVTNDSSARSDNQKKDKRQVNLNDRSKSSKTIPQFDRSSLHGSAREWDSMIGTAVQMDSDKKSPSPIRTTDESGNEIEDLNRIHTSPKAAGLKLRLTSPMASEIYDKNAKKRRKRRTRGQVENHTTDDQRVDPRDKSPFGSLESDLKARVRRDHHINSFEGSSHLEPNGKRVDPQLEWRRNQADETTQTLESQQQFGPTTANDKRLFGVFACGAPFEDRLVSSSGYHETEYFQDGRANKVESRASHAAVTIEPINERIRPTMEAKQVNGAESGSGSGRGSGGGSESESERGSSSRDRITRSWGRKMVYHAQERPQNDGEQQNEASPRREQLVDSLAIIVIDNGQLLQVATSETQRDFSPKDGGHSRETDSEPNAPRDNNSATEEGQKYKQERATLTLIESLLLASLESQNGSFDSHCGHFNITKSKKHRVPRNDNARLSTNDNNELGRDPTNYADITDADRVERRRIILGPRLAIGSNNNETRLLMARMGKNSEIGPQLERSIANPRVWGAIQTSANPDRINGFHVMPDRYRNRSRRMARGGAVRGSWQSKLNLTANQLGPSPFMSRQSNLLAHIPRVEGHKDETSSKLSHGRAQFYMKIKLLNRNRTSNKHEHSSIKGTSPSGSGRGSGRGPTEEARRGSRNQALRKSSQMLPLLLYINLDPGLNSTESLRKLGNDLQLLGCFHAPKAEPRRARQTTMPNGLINDDLFGQPKASTTIRDRNGKRAQSNAKGATKIDTNITDNNTECNGQFGHTYLALLVLDVAKQGHENGDILWKEMLSSVINSHPKPSRLYRSRIAYSNECWRYFSLRFCKNMTPRESHQTDPLKGNQNERRRRQRKRRRRPVSQQSNRRATFHKYSGCCSYDIRDTNGLDTHCCFSADLFEDPKAGSSKLHELNSGDKISFFVKILDIWLCGSIEHNLHSLGLICSLSGGYKSNIADAFDEKLNSIDSFNRVNPSYRHTDFMEVMIYVQLFDLVKPKLKMGPKSNLAERMIKDKRPPHMASISEAPASRLDLGQNGPPSASLSEPKSRPTPEASLAKPTPTTLTIDRKIVNKREVKIELSDLVDSNDDDDDGDNNNNNKQPNDGSIKGRKDKNKLNDYLINISMSTSDQADNVGLPSGITGKGGANRVDKAKVKGIDTTTTTTTTGAPSSYVPIYAYRAQNKKSGCALYDHKPYVIYSASGSFYIPMLIMIFFYSRIYLVASRAQKNLQRGYMTTKWPVNAKTRLESAASGISGNHEGEANSADYCNLSGPNLERVTLRIHRRQVSSASSAIVGSSAGPDKSNGTPSRTNSSELVRLASEKANQSLKNQQLASGLAKVASGPSDSSATSKGENCKRIRRQSPVECEDKDDTPTSVGGKEDTRADATTQEPGLGPNAHGTSEAAHKLKSIEDLSSLDIEHPTNQAAQDLTESTTTLTSGSCHYEIEPVRSSYGGKQRRHAYQQHHHHHHSQHQHQHQTQHEHRHHRRHHRHHHHHDNSGQSHSRVSNGTDDSGQNTPTTNGNQTTESDHGLHQHIHRHHRHRCHHHGRHGACESGRRQGCRELRDRQQSCDDAYLARMNSSTRHDLALKSGLVEQLSQCTSIAEETRANSSSSINKSTNTNDKQMDPSKHVQITLSLVNEPKPELAHKSELASERQPVSDAHLERARPIFVAITPPPFESRPQLEEAKLESQPDSSGPLDEPVNIRARAAASREACLTIGQSTGCSEQLSRTDRSHSCGPETPAIVVNWNSPSQLVENQLCKHKIMATSEQTLPTTELAQQAQLEGAHTSLGSSARPVDTPGAESLGSGLSLFPMAANQVRKQSIMLFNSITARGSETLRRLSMVAHHPVDSLLRRSKSHNSSDEQHSSSDEQHARAETGLDKKSRNMQRKKKRKRKRKRKHEHKRTIDDYLMAVAGIDTSSIDDDLGFTGDEQDDDDEDDDIDDNDIEDDEERNLSDDRMNLTALLQCERVNLPCVNVIEPVEDKLSNDFSALVGGKSEQPRGSRLDKSGHKPGENDVPLEAQQESDTQLAGPIDSTEQTDETSRAKQLDVSERKYSGQNIVDKSSVIVSITHNGPVSSLTSDSASKSATLEPVVFGQAQLKRAPRNAVSGRRRGAKRATLWHAKRLRAETKAAKTVAIIIGGFIFCWLPFFTAYLSRAIICTSPDCIPQSLLSLFIWLGYLNSAINPVIYGLVSADFRQAFKNILCRCRVRNNTKNTRVVSVLVDNIIKSMGV